MKAHHRLPGGGIGVRLLTGVDTLAVTAQPILNDAVHLRFTPSRYIARMGRIRHRLEPARSPALAPALPLSLFLSLPPSFALAVSLSFAFSFALSVYFVLALSFGLALFPASAIAQAGDPTVTTGASPGSGADQAVAEARRRYLGDLLDVKREDRPSPNRPDAANVPIPGAPIPEAPTWEVRLLAPDANRAGAQVIRVRVDDAGRFLEANGHDLVSATRHPPSGSRR